MIYNEAKELMELVASIYEQRKDEISVSPSWLAGEVLQALDPGSLAPPMVALAANLQLRQLARDICRKRNEEDDSKAPEQHQLFPGLQRRYPIKRTLNEEPQYVLLEHLSGEDIEFNVARLRLEGRAKLEHADALEAWGQRRRAGNQYGG